MSPVAALPIPAHLYQRDFLALEDFTPADILALLDLARALKEERKAGKTHHLLVGKSIACYFEKPSNRTRVSFEVGISDLGAHPIYLRKEEINLGVRETIADTARTLSRYVDGIMIRTFAHKDVEELAEAATVPVINGLTDLHHPCQVMADLQTFQEVFGSFEGKAFAFIGDGSNNMTHSLMVGAALVGLDFRVGTPEGYLPDPIVVSKAQAIAAQTGAKISVTHNPIEAVQGVHAVYTDVWASMGQEAEAQLRKTQFAPYQVNSALMAHADAQAIVLHCLPAHRDEEITHEVLEKHADVIFEQAENRLHAQKAVLVALMVKP